MALLHISVAVRDPDPDPGFCMNIPDHISESLNSFIRIRYLLDPGFGIRDGKIRIRDPL